MPVLVLIHQISLTAYTGSYFEAFYEARGGHSS